MATRNRVRMEGRGRRAWARLAIVAMAGALGAAAATRAAEKVIAAWSFDEGSGATAGDGAGGSHGRVVRAAWAEGRTGKALEFEDYSLLDYLKPDVTKATRVAVPHAAQLNPQGPFSLKATLFPTRDPIYYGGIAEKGRGLAASYRLLLLRGLRVRGALGSRAVVTSSAPLSLNAWHDVELRFDGKSLVLMVDGSEAGRAAAEEGAPPASQDELVIGERFSGKIDSVELLSR